MVWSNFFDDLEVSLVIKYKHSVSKCRSPNMKTGQNWGDRGSESVILCREKGISKINEF
jgi:hypothetical protein